MAGPNFRFRGRARGGEPRGHRHRDREARVRGQARSRLRVAQVGWPRVNAAPRPPLRSNDDQIRAAHLRTWERERSPPRSLALAPLRTCTPHGAARVTQRRWHSCTQRRQPAVARGSIRERRILRSSPRGSGWLRSKSSAGVDAISARRASNRLPIAPRPRRPARTVSSPAPAPRRFRSEHPVSCAGKRE